MIIALLSWWYTAGWHRLAHGAAERIGTGLEFFSVGLLLRTLFDPFRQIDAGKVRGSLQQQMQAFGNRLFSRVIGAVVRTFTILAGLIVAFLLTIFGLVQLLVWPLVPLLPLFGLLAALMGWTL
jgi:hypothetical protein